MNNTPMDVIRRFTYRHDGYPLCARVLYVEDDPGQGALVQAVLERAGFCVDVVARGETALDLIIGRPGRYKVGIFDHGLPDISGLDTIRCLRESGASIPAIMLTGVGTQELAYAAESLCVAAYMVKDVRGDYLVELPKIALELLGEANG